MHKFLTLLILGCLTLNSCMRCRNNCVHGTCIKRNCDCDTWYSGDWCNESVLKEYAGYYEGEMRFQGTGYIEPVAFNMATDDAEPSILHIENMNIVLQFTTHTRFDIPDQVWRELAVEGEGEMLIDLISFRMHYDDASGRKEVLVQAHRQH